MAPTRKTARLLQIAKDIVRAENELLMLRSEFDRLADDDGQGGVPSQIGYGKPPKPPPAASFPQRVQSVLDRNTTPLTAQEIAVQLGEPGSVDTIRAALSKLLDRGGVERVAMGLYRSNSAGHRSAAGDDD